MGKVLKYMREARKASRSSGRVQAQTDEACKFVSYRRQQGFYLWLMPWLRAS